MVQATLELVLRPPLPPPSLPCAMKVSSGFEGEVEVCSDDRGTRRRANQEIVAVTSGNLGRTEVGDLQEYEAPPL